MGHLLDFQLTHEVGLQQFKENQWSISHSMETFVQLENAIHFIVVLAALGQLNEHILVQVSLSKGIGMTNLPGPQPIKSCLTGLLGTCFSNVPVGASW